GDENSVAPVAQQDESSSLLRSRLKVRALPGAVVSESSRTDSSMEEPPAFNREVVSSNLTRCSDDGSVAQFRQRRLTQNEDVVGSNPSRTTEDVKPNWFTLALLYAQQFRGW